MTAENARVALVLRTQCAHSREALRGIIDAVWYGGGAVRRTTHASRPLLPWTLKLFSQLEHTGVDSLFAELRQFKADGIIFESFGEAMSDRINRLKCPVVELFWPSLINRRHPGVSVNDEQIGRMAAEHLIESGLRYFAFFGGAQYMYSVSRFAGFQRALHEFSRGKNRAPRPATDIHTFDRCPTDWRDRIKLWLDGLPRPIGIFAANDLFATEIVQELNKYQWSVPEDAAVLGVDDDELQCNLAYPPISSIQPGFRQAGRAAAKMLERLLNGEEVSNTVEISPLRVVVRHSTDITHVEDENVGVALRFIREHPTANLSVKVLLHRMATNRRHLERAFLETLGRTPLEEIHRVRILKIKELLLTGKSVEQAARDMHFSSSKYLTTLSHRVTDEGPNPRFVVTNLTGEAQDLYDTLYCARGQAENYIKEQQLGLFADRTSCHRFLANQFRVLLSGFAYILIDHLRRTALVGKELATAQADTIRLKLFKIGAVVKASVRRLVLHLSSAYPLQSLFMQVCERLGAVLIMPVGKQMSG